MYALDVLNCRVATWRRNTLLFLPEEVRAWKEAGYQAVLLASGTGSTGFSVWLDEIRPLTSMYHYAPWLGRPRLNLLSLGIDPIELDLLLRQAQLPVKERHATRLR